MTNQKWDVNTYMTNAAFVPELGNYLVDLFLSPEPEWIVIDLGCGDGRLTRKIMATGARVIGIDSDPDMVAKAINEGINAYCLDATDFSVNQLGLITACDAIFSNAALHWVTEPAKAINCIYTALKPGGRFVAEFGGYGNVASVCSAIASEFNHRNIEFADYNPWYFPTPTEYSELLRKQGFKVNDIKLFARPTPIGTDSINWLKVFAKNFLAAIPDNQQQSFIERLADRVEAKLERDKDNNYLLDYVRLMVVATKQS